MLAITMPGLRLTRLKSAAPVAISAEPPTMALLGMTPKGGKKACIEPPMPLLKPLSRGEDLGQRAVEHVVDGQVFDACRAG